MISMVMNTQDAHEQLGHVDRIYEDQVILCIGRWYAVSIHPYLSPAYSPVYRNCLLTTIQAIQEYDKAMKGFKSRPQPMRIRFQLDL
jgi:hypothetical protein